MTKKAGGSKLKKIISKLRFVVYAAVVAGMSYAIWQGVLNSEVTRVTEITVAGADTKTEARLLKRLEPARGRLLWKIKPEKAANYLKADPWIADIEVRRQFPHTLAVNVTERKPFAVLNNGNGAFTYVDSTNSEIDKADPKDMGQYPLLVGSVFHGNPELRARAIDLLKQLPDSGPISKNTVAEVQYDNEHGFHLTLTNSGLTVDVGHDNLPLHIDRARRVVSYLNEHKIDAVHVDSDYAKKVLVKVRKDR